MSVEDLGKEYEKHAEIQQHFIDKCKAEIKKAKQSGDTDTVTKLQSDKSSIHFVTTSVRLACLMCAASVYPEPGSNSLVCCLYIVDFSTLHIIF